MKRIAIDTDEAVLLDIFCTAGRDFDLTIDLHRSLTGEGFRLEVRDVAGAVILTFNQVSGTINLNGTSLVLHQSHGAMNLPAGVYGYDLINELGLRRENVTKGYFTIRPSVTQ